MVSGVGQSGRSGGPAVRLLLVSMALAGAWPVAFLLVLRHTTL